MTISCVLAYTHAVCCLGLRPRVLSGFGVRFIRVRYEHGYPQQRSLSYTPSLPTRFSLKGIPTNALKRSSTPCPLPVPVGCISATSGHLPRRHRSAWVAFGVLGEVRGLGLGCWDGFRGWGLGLFMSVGFRGKAKDLGVGAARLGII